MMNDAMFSKNPNTLAVSPACAVESLLFLRRDLARTIPARANGIAKDVRNRLPIPTQKEREINTLISPKKRLKIPLMPEFPLILLPPVAASPPVAVWLILKSLNNGYIVYVFEAGTFSRTGFCFTPGRFRIYSILTPTFPPSIFHS